jgi:2-polyprenyl-3-methyl-5-hydroxy-6-metoxy-1,4-benzoquinol methylase
MKQFLKQAGYILDHATSIWMNPNYAGIPYSDGNEIEMRIASVIQNASDITVLSLELRQHCIDWPSLYHLSGTRANILRPFQALLNGDVLEIGAGCGAITRYLGECGVSVLALEGSPRRAAIARSRTRDIDNVTVLAERFEDFQCHRKFDVITLIGVLEYANLFTSGENPHLSMLEQVSALLKPDGKLVIAIENQLGLKYFAGAPEDHHGIQMYGIEGRYKANQAETFGRRALVDMLDRAGLGHVETLAAFPDYKMPVSILTEEGSVAADFDAGTLARQSVAKDPQLPSKTFFKMERAWPVISRNFLAIELANSFLIVASKCQEKIIEQGVLAYHYSSDRAPGYCKEIVFSRTKASQIEVRDRLLSNSQQSDKLARYGIRYRRPDVSTYILGKPLSHQFIEIVTLPGWSISQCVGFFEDYLEVLRVCLQSDSSKLTDPHAGTVLPGDYLDAIPANIIIDSNGHATYIDREWCAEEGVLIDYLIFRAIMSLLGSTSVFATPADNEPTTRGDFTIRIMEELGFLTHESAIVEYLKLESNLGAYSSGIEDKVFSSWSPEGYLPGLTPAITIEKLQETLNVTLEAKQNAERFAHSHMSELLHLQAQLQATEAAKAEAERLAHSHMSELQHLQAQYTGIQNSTGYKLLTALRLTPNKNDSNV